MRKAQSTLEYTLVIAVFVAALISMTVYIKRGFQGNYRQTADEIGSAYEPKNTTSDKTLLTTSISISTSKTKEVTNAEGVKKLRTETNFDTPIETTSLNGTEEVGPLE